MYAVKRHIGLDTWIAKKQGHKAGMHLRSAAL